MGNRKVRQILSAVLSIMLLLTNIAYADTSNTEPAKYNDIVGNKYETQIREWIANGLIKGYPDGNFKPGNQITRAEFMTLVNRAFGFIETTSISYSDVSKADWYYKEAEKATKAGFIKGDNGRLLPLNNISRQETAMILARLTKNETAAADEAVINNLNDAKSIPGWSTAVISTGVKKGFFEGFTDKSFKPEEKITRLEAVVTLDRAFKSMFKAVCVQKGVFGPESGTQTLDGDVAVIAPDVILKNVVINGNLILRETIGEGNVYLDNVVVKGETIVKGGGEHSIVIKNSTLSKVTVIKEGNTVRIVATGTTSIANVNVGSNVRLEEDQLTGNGFNDVMVLDDIPVGANVVFEGNFDDIQIDSAKINVTVESGTIGSLTLAKEATDTNVNLAQEAKVTTLTLNSAANVTGTGSIGTANINANGAIIEQKPTTVNVATGVNATVGGAPATPTTPPAPSASGGGSSGGGGGGSHPANSAPVARNVTITGEAVAGKTLTGNYTYSDAENDIESGSTFNWYRASSIDGDKRNIPGAKNRTYTVQAEDIGMYLFFEVTPIAASGTRRGNAVVSDASSQVIAVYEVVTGTAAREYVETQDFGYWADATPENSAFNVGFKLNLDKLSYKDIEKIEVSLVDAAGNELAKRTATGQQIMKLKSEDETYGSLDGQLSAAFIKRTEAGSNEWWNSTPYSFTTPAKAVVKITSNYKVYTVETGAPTGIPEVQEITGEAAREYVETQDFGYWADATPESAAYNVGFKLNLDKLSYENIEKIEVSLADASGNTLATRTATGDQIMKLKSEDKTYGSLDGQLSAAFVKRTDAGSNEWWNSTPYDFSIPAKAVVRITSNYKVYTVETGAPTGIGIENVSQLVEAIKNQSDNQTWYIEAGDYALAPISDYTAKGQDGWYFPITANNITVKGIGNPVLYGNVYTPNSSLPTQNLVTIFGSNVTLDGLTLMPKIEGNKTIEVVGANATIQNCTIEPNTKVANTIFDNFTNNEDKEFNKQWGGSLYFSAAGNHNIKDVTIKNAGISFRYSPAGTHIKFENVNIIYNSNIDDINGYRYSTGFNNENCSTDGDITVTYEVDKTMNNLASAVNNAGSGDTIRIAQGTYEEQVVIKGKDLTIIGAVDSETHTRLTTIKSPMTLTDSFITTSANKPIILVENANAKISNIIIDGANRGGITANYRFQGIGFYNAGGVVENCEIMDIADMQNDQPISGMQHGLGIYAYNNDGVKRALVIENNIIHDYQKGGIALSGANLNVNVSSNEVYGIGRTPAIAQNGIQIGYGAAGTIEGNVIAGNWYTGTVDAVSTGILLYECGEVAVSNNILDNNQVAIYKYDNSGNEVETNVVPENFNTHKSSDYKGINVGFRLEGDLKASDLSGIEVTVQDGDAVFGRNIAKIDEINGLGDEQQLSTPFVISPEDFSDKYWNFDDKLIERIKPSKAVIKVTDKDGNTYVAENNNLAEPDGILYEELFYDDNTPGGVQLEITNPERMYGALWGSISAEPDKYTDVEFVVNKDIYLSNGDIVVSYWTIDENGDLIEIQGKDGEQSFAVTKSKTWDGYLTEIETGAKAIDLVKADTIYGTAINGNNSSGWAGSERMQSWWDDLWTAKASGRGVFVKLEVIEGTGHSSVVYCPIINWTQIPNVKESDVYYEDTKLGSAAIGIQVMDALGNPIKGLEASDFIFKLSDEQTLDLQQFTEHENGVYTFIYNTNVTINTEVEIIVQGISIKKGFEIAIGDVDTTAPELLTAAVQGNILELQFDEELSEDTLNNDNFIIKVNNETVGLNDERFSWDKNSIRLYIALDKKILSDDIIEVNYSVQDAVGNLREGCIESVQNNTPEIDGYEADEQDNTYAKYINLNEIQSHTIAPAGDLDWLYFTVDTEDLDKTFVIETSKLSEYMDTYIYLYQFKTDEITGRNEYVFLNEDDDNGYGLGSRIEFTPTEAGDYFIRVEHYDNGYSTGSYDILVNIADESEAGLAVQRNSLTEVPSMGDAAKEPKKVDYVVIPAVREPKPNK